MTMVKSKGEFEIEKKAISFRQQNGLSSTEPIRLKSLLLKNNVLTIFKPLSQSFSGMAVKVSNHRFVLVSTQQSIGKQHFTIGHELYHLFIQENFTSQTCRTGIFDRKDIEEYRADWFAAFLLLPEEGVLQMIPDEELTGKGEISLQTILKIEHYYSVSRRALLYRLLKLGFINEDRYEYYKDGVKRGALQNGYPTHLYDHGNNNEIVGDYGTVANQLFSSDKISESHYLELMNAIGFNPLEQNEDVENGKG
jgi:Zn-dependent peptidase ImmA (M78 family)